MDNVSQTETNHPTTKRLDLLRGRRTYHPDIPTSHGGVYHSENANLMICHTTIITYKSLHWFAPLTSYTKLLPRRRNETSDVINAIIFASSYATTDHAVRARFATVRASPHPRTSEWNKHLEVHEETRHQVTSSTPTDLCSERRPVVKESPLVVDSEILWHSAESNILNPIKHIVVLMKWRP